jgi:multidrug efflux pump subunit AcrA (membrane-fusion protein)
LYDEKVITKQEFDQYTTQKNVAQLQYQQAQAGVQQARAGLGEVKVFQSYARVTAPVSGIVTQRNIDLGSTAIQGQPILTIEATGEAELVANIDESYLDKVKENEYDLLLDEIAVRLGLEPPWQNWKHIVAPTSAKKGDLKAIKGLLRDRLHEMKRDDLFKYL